MTANQNVDVKELRLGTEITEGDGFTRVERERRGGAGSARRVEAAAFNF